MHYIFNVDTVPPNTLFEKEHNVIIKKIISCHFSLRINKVFNIPCKWIWYRHIVADKKMENEDIYYFVFFEGTQIFYDRKYIVYLRHKYPNCRIIFRYTNPINSYNSWNVRYVKSCFDLIISMDKTDCDRNGWVYVPNTYRTVKNENYQVDNDVFFVGRDKRRLPKLIKIYDYLTYNGLKCDFYISNVEKWDSSMSRPGIHLIDYMKYNQTLEHIKKSRCLLEVLQEQQTGSSLRPMESITYDKILITNNQNIKYEDYYDKDNMVIFKDIEELNIDEIRKKNVKYINKEIIANKVLFDAIQNHLQFRQ